MCDCCQDCYQLLYFAQYYQLRKLCPPHGVPHVCVDPHVWLRQQCSLFYDGYTTPLEESLSSKALCLDILKMQDE